MVLPMTKKRIQEVEKQITRDFSNACETAYTLPLEFSEPKRVKGLTYRVSADVIAVKNKYYPTGVFAGNVFNGIDGKILVLKSEYESLGIPFGTGDGEFLFALKIPNSKAQKIEELVEKMYFDINASELTYSMPEGVTEEKQKI